MASSFHRKKGLLAIPVGWAGQKNVISGNGQFSLLWLLLRICQWPLLKGDGAGRRGERRRDGVEEGETGRQITLRLLGHWACVHSLTPPMHDLADAETAHFIAKLRQSTFSFFNAFNFYLAENFVLYAGE